MSETPSSIHLMVSYARTDSAFVDRIEADLRTRGYQVWVDRRRLEGGQQWNAEIQRAINTCDILLLVLSPDALASPHVQQEYRLALKRRKPVIPVRYFPTPTLPSELTHLQYVNFQAGVNFEETYAAGMRELVQAIEAHTGAILAAREAAARATREQSERVEQARRRAEEARARRQAQPANASAVQLAVAGVRAAMTQPVIRLVGGLALGLLVVSSGVLVFSQVQQRAARAAMVYAQTATAGAIGTRQAAAQQTLAPQQTAQAATAAAVASLTAVASAATATAVFVSPYVAPIPGKCDQGGATWLSFENSGQFTGSMSCTPDGLDVNGNVSAEFQGAAGRAGYSTSGTPPSQYRASVDVSFGSSGSNGSPVLGAHFGAFAYSFGVTPDGTWNTAIFNGNQYSGGNTGLRPTAASYTLTITAQSGFVTFAVNGTQVDKLQLASGSTQPTGLWLGSNSGGPAYYRNFVFTPMQ